MLFPRLLDLVWPRYWLPSMLHQKECVTCVFYPNWQGSHSDWKTCKNGKAFSSQGKVREFWTDWKSQGKLHKILENSRILFDIFSDYLNELCIITGRNEVVAKVMFLHVSVILLTGGVFGEPPQDQGEPPQTRQTPRDQGEPPGPGRPPRDQGEPPQHQAAPPAPGRPPPSPLGRTLQHTVNERPVHILLECILVC